MIPNVHGDRLDRQNLFVELTVLHVPSGSKFDSGGLYPGSSLSYPMSRRSEGAVKDTQRAPRSKILYGAPSGGYFDQIHPLFDLCINNAIVGIGSPMPRPKGSAELLEDRRKRAWRCWLPATV